MRIIPAPQPSLTSYGLTAWLLRFGVGPDTVKELADLGG